MKRLLLILVMISLASLAFAASSLQRNLPQQAERCSEVDIELLVDVDQDSYFAIDETIPEGWAVADPGNADTSEQGHLKWLVISGAKDTTYKYTLQAPCHSFGTHGLEGAYMFSGDDSVKNFHDQIEIPPEDCEEKKCIGEDPFEGISTSPCFAQ